MVKKTMRGSVKSCNGVQRPAMFEAAARSLGLLAALGVAPLLGGCGDFLDRLISVEAPSRIQAETLETPENAGRLLDGAVGDFECAFGHYVLFQSVFTEELQYAQGSESWRAIDGRDLDASGFDAPHALSTCSSLHQGQVPGVYKPLSTARWQTDHLMELLDRWKDQEVASRDVTRATAAAYSGYSHLLLGESMCSAAFDLGPGLEPKQIFPRAEERFSTAIDLARGVGDNNLLNLALVGRARTRQNLANQSGARADAAQVPVGFVWNAEFSAISPRRENIVWVRSVRTNNVTVEAPYRTLNDPRVAVADQKRLSSSGIAIWYQLKYTAANSPIPLATWREAQLIVAEAELAAGNLAAALTGINRVRTRSGVALPPFASSDAAAIRAQLLRERQAELFLEAHRLGDIRRYNLPLDPPAGAVYPLGGIYGDQRCLPLPDVERFNNPNIGSR